MGPSPEVMPLHEKIAVATLRFTSGSDVFISYARADGSDYATALANALSAGSQPLDCYLDQLDTRPGIRVPKEVLRAARNAKGLVIIASPAAINSKSMSEEIEAFMRVPGPVTLVTFACTDVSDAVWREQIAGIAPAPEPGGHNALRSGTPSSDVLKRITNAVGYWKRNTVIRFASRFGLAVLLATGVAVVLTAREANRQVAKAAVAEQAADVAEQKEAKATRNATAASSAIGAQDLLVNAPQAALKAAELAANSLEMARTSWGEFVARNVLSVTPRLLTRRPMAGLGQRYFAVPNAFQDQVAAGPNGLVASWSYVERSEKTLHFSFQLLDATSPGTKEINAVELSGFISDVKFLSGGAGAIVELSADGSFGEAKTLALVRQGNLAVPIGTPGVATFAAASTAPLLALARTDTVELWSVGSQPALVHTWNLPSVTKIGIDSKGTFVYAISKNTLYQLDTDVQRISPIDRPPHEVRKIVATDNHVIIEFASGTSKSFDLRSRQWDHTDLEFGDIIGIGDERVMVRQPTEVMVYDLTKQSTDYYAGRLSLKCPQLREQDVLVTSVGLSTSRKAMILGCATGPAIVAQLKGGVKVATAPLDNTWPAGLWLDDGTGILTVYAVGRTPQRPSMEGEASSWKILNKCSPEIEAVDGTLTLSSGGRVLVALSNDQLRVFDIETGRQMFAAPFSRVDRFERGSTNVSSDGRSVLVDGSTFFRFREGHTPVSMPLRLIGYPLATMLGGADGADLIASTSNGPSAASVVVGNMTTGEWQERLRLEAGAWTRHAQPDDILVSPVAISSSGDIAYLAPPLPGTDLPDYERIKTVRLRRADGRIGEVSLSSTPSALQFKNNDEIVIGTRSGDVFVWRPTRNTEALTLIVCRFHLRGRRLSGDVVALLTSRAALLPRAAQSAFCE